MGLLPPCVPEDCGKGINGKNFGKSLHQPSPMYTATGKFKKIRVVPAFTIQAMQDNTRVKPPKKCGVFEPQPVRPTKFRQSYLRGEFPLSIEYTSKGNALSWKFPIEKLDFHHYLPMFFEGLSEGSYPYNFIVEQGIKDLVRLASHKVLPVIPQLIVPIKNAFATKRPVVMCYTLRCINMLVTGCDKVGEALVPYYRQILPIMYLFMNRNHKEKDIDHIIVREESVPDMIEDTLNILERYGGPDAFINIKYQIPTYESCLLN